MRYKTLVQLLSKETEAGQMTISKTLSEYKPTETIGLPSKETLRLKILEKTSEEIILAIRKKIHEFWFRREIPDMKKILAAVNLDPQLPAFSESSLYRLLKRMEFKYIVHARNSALIDKENIVSWRQKYIQQIQKYRSEGCSIYYLGETWVDVEDVGRRPRVDTSVTCPTNIVEKGLSTEVPEPSSKGKCLIIAHVGSSDGFVVGALLCFEATKNSVDYRNEINGDTFFDWFRSFLPMLGDGAVIVMDNAPYHNKKVEQYPTMSWKKNDIIAWLVGKGEKVEPRYVKAQLLKLTQKHRRPDTNYVIDEYAKEHGHTVLRLPPYHCDLNPIELAWANIKEYVSTRDTTYKLSDVLTLLNEALENMSAETWQNFIRRTMEKENRLRQLDHITDSILDETGEWVDPFDDSDGECDL